MIRLLLSLLALVSGLAVQVVPARARLCESQASASAPAAAAAQVEVRVAVSAITPRAEVAQTTGRAQRLPSALTIAVPGVLIGIDRARE